MFQFFYRCITADLLYIKVKAFRGLRFRGSPLRPSGFGGQAGFTSYPNRKLLPSRLGPRHGELPKKWSRLRAGVNQNDNPER
jgi:hypothetical protein